MRENLDIRGGDSFFYGFDNFFLFAVQWELEQGIMKCSISLQQKIGFSEVVLTYEDLGSEFSRLKLEACVIHHKISYPELSLPNFDHFSEIDFQLISEFWVDPNIFPIME